MSIRLTHRDGLRDAEPLQLGSEHVEEIVGDMPQEGVDEAQTVQARQHAQSPSSDAATHLYRHSVVSGLPSRCSRVERNAGSFSIS
jgi:hypothetical protein